MSDSIEAKKKSRKVLRCSFTKIANELETTLKAVLLPHSQIAVLSECLRSKYGELKAVDQIIYDHLLDTDATEEVLLVEMDQNDAYHRRFVDLKFQSEKPAEQPLEVLGVRSTNGCRGEVHNDHLKGKRKFQLPIIQFKLFEGNIRDWLGFWSQFKKVHEDMDIDSCDKIEYLIQATVDGSRARRIVESFPSVGENYEKIIDCLKSRFGREDLQIEVYVRELLKLVLNRTLSPSKNDLAHLYDQIETQLRALDTLGINSDRYAALLLPLIESCLPLDLLRIWQRSTFNNSQDAFSVSGSQSEEFSVEGRLNNLMRFLRSEVENELRVDLACAGFGLSENMEKLCDSERKNSRDSEKRKTAAALLHGDMERCIFCTGNHESQSCFKAQKMSFEERKRILTEKKACFKCLKIGHQSRKCRMRLRCIICGFSHVALMCQGLPNKQRGGKSSDEKVESEKNHAMTNQSLNTHVFLQTLRMSLKGANGVRSVRGLIDSGSQRSYILKSTAIALNLKPKRTEKITHCLFGGSQVDNTHYCYDITIVNGPNRLSFEVLDQPCICNDVATVFYGPWIQELKIAGIEVSDRHDSGPIELLFGADIAGLLYTGKRNVLKNGLVAYETRFGWTIEGKVPAINSCSMLSTISMLANPSITELWQLDVLGISDPKERKSREELALAARRLFEDTVEVNREGRYEVRLPWLEDHPALPSNLEIARKRLASTLKKLEADQLTLRYKEVFEEWRSMGIIEEVDVVKEKDEGYGHFLPHRPVVKEGSTTAVRPVFDASARDKRNPSLNQCLEKGQNLIELIPSLLIRFRQNKIAVIADIKKAFLQVSVSPKDRKFLRFLWVDDQGKEVTYQHNRVVFGVNCSPFLLGATIEYHLSKCLERSSDERSDYFKNNIEILRKSFYVDNCVTSVLNEEVLDRFIRDSVQVMTEAGFELRGWEFSGNVARQTEGVPVLGLRWYPTRDVLTINKDLINLQDEDMVVTKRKLLSVAQKIFDPIGFTCPATLRPKLWLQELWSRNIGWDVARRGRPKIIYSDNGKNFRGTENLFENLYWEKIMRETSIQRIEWRFNPPTASWWGGFFERLIGVVKSLLRKVLGCACLNYEDLMTLLCDCEATVNTRPLTYISNDPTDLSALTPAMFLRDQIEAFMPDCDVVEKSSLSRSIRNKQRLRENLRQRFRSEYLGQLKLTNDHKSSASVKLGQIVLIGNDFSKRIDWPLGRVIEIIPGKNGQIRIVRVRTSCGELLRPVRRLYPLEYDGGAVSEEKGVDETKMGPELTTTATPVHMEEEEDEICDSGSAEVKISRVPENDSSVERISCSGRRIKFPRRLLD